MKFSLDLKKSVEENASYYFDKSKKLKKKAQGAKKAIEETKNKIKKRDKSDKQKELFKNVKQKDSSRTKNWYEKYKWFISSEGLLVVGGKDANSNEDIIKKHMEPEDLVLHTLAPGSPFTLIKNSKKATKITKKEAAEFTATNSKAWSLGISSLEAFVVKPNQVSKTAMSGEYVSKGSFMVTGKREIYKVSPNIGIGINKENYIMHAPISAIKNNCESYVLLKQGHIKKEEMTKILMKLFQTSKNEVFLSQLPQGKFLIDKKVNLK